ncbi:MAG: hypothetical protein QW451_00270 [Candidatus Aenigmatarchaeota archaeon]
MVKEKIKYFLLILSFIGIALIGISIYSSIFPEAAKLELRLNLISLLSGFSYLIFVFIIWGLYVKK